MTDNVEDKLIKVISPIFQITAICISVACITFALFKGLSALHIHEKSPQIEIVTPKTVKELGGFPNEVTTGLYIHEFQKFDIVNNDFLFSGIVWFLFNPGIISLETLKKFEFDRGTIIERSEPNVTVLDKKLLARFPIRAHVAANLDYRYFPLDDHRIYFVLTHPLVSPENILLASSNQEFSVKPDVRTTGWQKIDITVISGYGESPLDIHDERKTLQYPSIVFSIDYARHGTRYVISILLPLLLIFYLTLFTFSFGDTSSRTSISLSTGSITAILAYRFVIENLSPNTGYFMLSDYLFFLFLGGSFLVFFTNIIDAFAINIPIVYKKFIIILLHTIVITTSIYLFIFW